MTENGNEELKWSEKMFHGQGNVGWSLTFDMTNKYPLISKRIFDELSDLKGYIDDPTSSAIEGLVLTVVNDEVDANNGAYLVTGVKRYQIDENGITDINATIGEGKCVKIGTSDNTQKIFEVVTERPEIGEEGKIYLVRVEATEGGVVYEEYIYKNSKWEGPIGTQTLDFDIDNIYNKSTIDGKFSKVNNRLDNVYTKSEVYTKGDIDGFLKDLPSGGGGTVSGDYIPTSAIKTGTVSDDSDPNLVASASHNHDGSPVYTSIIAHTDSKPKDGEEGDVNSNFAGIDIKDTSVSIGYHTDEGDDAKSIIEIGADYLDSEQDNVLMPYIKIYNGGNELNLIQEILYLKQKVEELSAIAGISGVTNITSKNIGNFAVTSLTPVEDDIVISGKTGDIKISVVNISKVLYDDAEPISNNDKNN